METKKDLVGILFEAINKGNLDEVKSLIEEENVKITCFDENGMSPLMQAAYKGNESICLYLIEKGADVNATENESGYTALMLAALAGHIKTAALLLHSKAKIQKCNKIGKTASALAAFVGQHECANLITNYLSIDKLDPYVIGQGDNEPRLIKAAAVPLQSIVTSFNPHPVQVILSVMDDKTICNVDTLQQMVNTLSDLRSKCVRSKVDFDEGLALRVHYYCTMLDVIKDFLESNPGKKLDSFIKKFLQADENGFPIAVEKSLRKCFQGFPYPDLPLLQTFVMTISKTKMGSQPTSLHCLMTMFYGAHSTARRYNTCGTCGKNASALRCSACKQISYCTKRCQKLHWSIHKKFCNKSLGKTP